VPTDTARRAPDLSRQIDRHVFIQIPQIRQQKIHGIVRGWPRSKVGDTVIALVGAGLVCIGALLGALVIAMILAAGKGGGR
jgi:hypothetical protein